MSNERRKVKWGVMGCSGVGKDRTIPGIANSADGVVYALASRSEAKLSEYAAIFHPEKCYTSYDALLDDENVEAVYIPLPNDLHYEWVLKAAAKKKHILCEKPMALTEKQATEMFEACEKNGVLLMEAYAYRVSPLVQKVKSLIDEGAVGKVKYIETVHTNRVTNKTGIRFQIPGGGNFYDVACYNVSLLGYLTGQEPAVMSVMKEMDEETGVDVSSHIQFGYKGGLTAALYSAMNCYPKGRFSVLGEEGRIEVLNKFNSRGLCKVLLTKYGRGQNAEIVDEIATEYTIWCGDNYRLEMEHFEKCILDGIAPEVSKEETIRNARILDRIMAEAKTV